MATRHRPSAQAPLKAPNDERSSNMAGSKETGLKVLDNGDVVDLATGEVVERHGSQATAEEIDARELANREAKSDPDLLDALDHKAIAWRSQEGDTLIGIVVDRYDREGIMKNDGTVPLYPVIEVRIASGDVIAFHAFHTAAHSQIDKRNPQPGDRIAVRRLGEVSSPVKGRQAYTDYNIVVRKHQGDGTMIPTGNSGGTVVSAEPANADWNRP
jgi:hypothetical protein